MRKKRKKYELLLEETTCFEGHVLHRIRWLRARGIPSIGVKAGDKGGFIESEDNLSQEGDCWVGGEACAYGRTRVYDNGLVLDHARVEDSIVCGNSVVEKYAVVEDGSYISGSTITDHAVVTHDSMVIGKTIGGYDWVKWSHH